MRVSGDAVNFCSRIAGELGRSLSGRLQGLNDTRFRLKQASPGAREERQRAAPLDWHDRAIFPARVRFEDGSILALPSQDIVRFGRLEELDGVRVNDIVLHVADPSHRNRVSRWHFELHRGLAGFMLRSVSEAPTEVDGQGVSKGEQAAVRQGTRVRVGGVLTLDFLGDPTAGETDQSTMLGG
jgi:hypothetical protein